MTSTDLLYCYNCTKHGHESSTCYNYQWSQHYPAPEFVSDYTNKSNCENSIRINTTNEDFIPLVKSKKLKKTNPYRNIILPQGSVNIPDSSVLYSYGTFHTTKPDGQEMYKRLEEAQLNDLKDHFPPPFFSELIKTVQFEVLIYRSSDGELQIRIRSTNGNPSHIYEIFLFWLKVKDEGKHLNLYINIPRNSKQMFKFLSTKWLELEQNLQDPNSLCKQIEELKRSKLKTRNYIILKDISERILSFWGTLLYMSHVNSKLSRHIIGLQCIIKKLKCMMHNSPHGTIDIKDRWYLRTVHAYNQIFSPRTLTRSELHGFLHQYYKDGNNKKNNGKSTKKEKRREKQAQHLNHFKKFISSLRKYKLTLQKKERSVDANISITLPP